MDNLHDNQIDCTVSLSCCCDWCHHHHDQRDHRTIASSKWGLELGWSWSWIVAQLPIKSSINMYKLNASDEHQLNGGNNLQFQLIFITHVVQLFSPTLLRLLMVVPVHLHTPLGRRTAQLSYLSVVNCGLACYLLYLVLSTCFRRMCNSEFVSHSKSFPNR